MDRETKQPIRYDVITGEQQQLVYSSNKKSRHINKWDPRDYYRRQRKVAATMTPNNADIKVPDVFVSNYGILDSECSHPRALTEMYYGIPNVLVLIRFTHMSEIRRFATECSEVWKGRMKQFYHFDEQTSEVHVYNSKNFLFCCFNDIESESRSHLFFANNLCQWIARDLMRSLCWVDTIRPYEIRLSSTTRVTELYRYYVEIFLCDTEDEKDSSDESDSHDDINVGTDFGPGYRPQSASRFALHISQKSVSNHPMILYKMNDEYPAILLDKLKNVQLTEVERTWLHSWTLEKSIFEKFLRSYCLDDSKSSYEVCVLSARKCRFALIKQTKRRSGVDNQICGRTTSASFGSSIKFKLPVTIIHTTDTNITYKMVRLFDEITISDCRGRPVYYDCTHAEPIFTAHELDHMPDYVRKFAFEMTKEKRFYAFIKDMADPTSALKWSNEMTYIAKWKRLKHHVDAIFPEQVYNADFMKIIRYEPGYHRSPDENIDVDETVRTNLTAVSSNNTSVKDRLLEILIPLTDKSTCRLMLKVVRNMSTMVEDEDVDELLRDAIEGQNLTGFELTPLYTAMGLWLADSPETVNTGCNGRLIRLVFGNTSDSFIFQKTHLLPKRATQGKTHQIGNVHSNTRTLHSGHGGGILQPVRLH